MMASISEYQLRMRKIIVKKKPIKILKDCKRSIYDFGSDRKNYFYTIPDLNGMLISDKPCHAERGTAIFKPCHAQRGMVILAIYKSNRSGIFKHLRCYYSIN
jgi:hypothetical protein